MKSLLEEGFIGVDMPPLPDDIWNGVGLLLLTDEPTFSGTFSETETTWSTPENESVTTTVNPRNGIIRWYDPVVGRWLSKDPIGIAGGLNQYEFCRSNPVNRRDPFGLADLNLFSNTDDEWKYAEGWDYQNAFTIAGHGIRQGDGSPIEWMGYYHGPHDHVSYTPEQLAKLILAEGSGYKMGQDIYLGGCATGEEIDGHESLATELSRILNKDRETKINVWGTTSTITWEGAANAFGEIVGGRPKHLYGGKWTLGKK